MSHGRHARKLSGVVLLLFLFACATPPQTLKIHNSPPGGISRVAELRDVPFFPQMEYQCGPAALATLAKHKGIEVSPDQLINRVYIPDKQGSLQLEMVATARSMGLLGYKLEPRLENILTEIDHGNAVLVFQNLSLEIWPKWHYAVAVGYNLDKSQLVLRSGTTKRHITSFSTFENTWRRANYWAYVLARVGEIPATVSMIEHIRASHDLQEFKGIDYALPAFHSGIERWPEHSLMLVTLANAEYNAGNWQSAIDHYLTEVRLRPDNSTAWNNLSYALRADGCRQEAILAAQCAQVISPDDVNIQQTLNEISLITAINQKSCEAINCPFEMR